MKNLAIILYLGIGMYFNITFSQIVPDLSDNTIACFNGAIPYYTSCDVEPCEGRIFYSNGNLLASGECEDGKKVGVWTSYFENGKIQSRGIIKNGMLYDHWLFYWKSGIKKAEGAFTIGQFELGCAGSENYNTSSIMNGEWTFWDKRGKVEMTCNFIANENQEETLNGEFVTFYPNGNKKEEGVYHKGMKNGIWTYWYSNGNKKKEEYYQYKDCGLFDYISYECPAGNWTFWREDGSVLKTETYRNGVLEN